MAIGVEKVRAANTWPVPVITGLDHVVVLTGDINAASAAYQTLFARAPAWQNSGEGADRVLFTLDNTTLELMAPSGEGANADRICAVLAAQGEGLATLALRTSDIARMHRRLERLMLKPDAIADVESHDAISGATLSWKRTRAATEATRGVRLFFLERDKELLVGANHDRIDHGAWTMSWSRRRTPSGLPPSMARGSASTWRSTARIPIGAG